MLPAHVRSSSAAAAQSTRTKDMRKAHPPVLPGDALFYSCAGNYAPLCIRTVSTSVRMTKTRPNHFVACHHKLEVKE